MSYPQFEKDMNIISALSDLPNDEDGLSADQLKSKFDEAGLSVKDYINNTLLPSLPNVTQALTDSQADVPSGKAVNDALQAAGNLPTGGSSGSFLVKSSPDNYDAEWRYIKPVDCSTDSQSLSETEQQNARYNISAAKQIHTHNTGSITDIEYGVWDPTLITVANASVNTDNSYGYYIKIGNVISLCFKIIAGFTSGSSSRKVKIGHLPAEPLGIGSDPVFGGGGFVYGANIPGNFSFSGWQIGKDGDDWFIFGRTCGVPSAKSVPDTDYIYENKSGAFVASGTIQYRCVG